MIGILINNNGKTLFTALPKETEKLEKQLSGMCSIMVRWYNGQGLSLVPGVDSFHVISQEESQSEAHDMGMQL